MMRAGPAGCCSRHQARGAARAAGQPARCRQACQTRAAPPARPAHRAAPRAAARSAAAAPWHGGEAPGLRALCPSGACSCFTKRKLAPAASPDTSAASAASLAHGPGSAARLWGPNPGPAQEVVVVNTHLLYPHNACSTIIRLREVHKILEYLQARAPPLEQGVGCKDSALSRFWALSTMGQGVRLARAAPRAFLLPPGARAACAGAPRRRSTARPGACRRARCCCAATAMAPTAAAWAPTCAARRGPPA
jgi:hypothetical protein